MRDTAIWANKNPQLTAVILARESKMNPDIAAKMYRAVYPERLEASRDPAGHRRHRQIRRLAGNVSGDRHDVPGPLTAARFFL